MNVYDNFLINTVERWKTSEIVAHLVTNHYLPHPQHQIENIIPHLAHPTAVQVVSTRSIVTDTSGCIGFQLDSPGQLEYWSVPVTCMGAALVFCEFTPWCIRPWYLAPLPPVTLYAHNNIIVSLSTPHVMWLDKTQMFLGAAKAAIIRNQGASPP